MLYLAWRYGNHDPYKLYNGLDESWRPVGGGEPRPPATPWRVRAFVYACGVFAHEESVEHTQAIVGGTASRGMM